jgi:hypothetical protein
MSKSDHSLFWRRELPSVYTAKESTKGVFVPYEIRFQVILPSLNQKARTILADRRKQILETSTSYASAFAVRNSTRLGEGNKFPLSKLGYAGSGEGAGGEFQQYSEQNSTHSPFVASSGHGDVFQSISVGNYLLLWHQPQRARHTTMERFIASRKGAIVACH